MLLEVMAARGEKGNRGSGEGLVVVAVAMVVRRSNGDVVESFGSLVDRQVPPHLPGSR